jgi:hypothetical protein
MRILFDECVPRPFKREFSVHEVHTVPEMGWAGKKNGALLALMSQNAIDVLVTTDRNMRHQQNLAAFKVSVVLLLATSNRLADLLPLVPAVEAALINIQAGILVEICA